jgi:hypothetical protein
VKHKPGPWYAGEVIEDAYGRKSATIGWYKARVHYEDTIADVYSDNMSEEEFLANVELIRKAPELHDKIENNRREIEFGFELSKETMKDVRKMFEESIKPDIDRLSLELAMALAEARASASLIDTLSYQNRQLKKQVEEARMLAREMYRRQNFLIRQSIDNAQRAWINVEIDEPDED